MLRIAFAGTPEFAVPTLRALAGSAHRLVGVLTQPDRPAGRGRELRASPVKSTAVELGLPVAQPARLKSPEEQAALAHWAPDVLVVAAYGLILPPAVLSLPRHGCVNVHASLLPRWRGAAPIQRAILAGDEHSGVTIMQMEAGLDTGPMLLRRLWPIGPHTSAAELEGALAREGAAGLLQALELLETGRLQPEPQPLEGVTYARKLSKSEARVDWRDSAASLERQIRAFNPWPVAQAEWRGQMLRLWEAVADETAPSATQPGQLLGLDPSGLRVACGRGVLVLQRVQLPGRKVVSAREFAGAHDLSGAYLT